MMLHFNWVVLYCMSTRGFKIFSFFSGSGFLDLGFETNGFTVEFVNEFFAPFMEAYKYSRQKMGIPAPKYGYCNTDINDYLGDRSDELAGYIEDARSDGSLVGFIGGPPCPDFSVAGKNKGRHGDNGKLSLSYVNLIINQMPDFFLFENVKGLWRTARHREFFEELKGLLHKAGYYTTERLTNSLEFGVAQDRDRILLVGIKKALLDAVSTSPNPPDTAEDIGDNVNDATPVNANPLNCFPWNKYIKYSMDDIKKMPWPKTEAFSAGSSTVCPEGVVEELTVEHWFKQNNVDYHPNSKAFFIPRSGIVRMETVDEGDDCKKSYKRLHRWRYSPTAAYGNNEVHLHPYLARRISAAEALAIQSLPPQFELPQTMTLTNMFKTIGNGVPYLLSSGIAKTIRDYLEETVCKN